MREAFKLEKQFINFINQAKIITIQIYKWVLKYEAEKISLEFIIRLIQIILPIFSSKIIAFFDYFVHLQCSNGTIPVESGKQVKHKSTYN